MVVLALCEMVWKDIFFDLCACVLCTNKLIKLIKHFESKIFPGHRWKMSLNDSTIDIRSNDQTIDASIKSGDIYLWNIWNIFHAIWIAHCHFIVKSTWVYPIYVAVHNNIINKTTWNNGMSLLLLSLESFEPINDAWFWHKQTAQRGTHTPKNKLTFTFINYSIIIKYIELFAVCVSVWSVNRFRGPKLWGVCGYLNKWIFLK